jgi:hypothetical protein
MEDSNAERGMLSGMLTCALCGRPLKPTAAWKGRGERYYCGEFCAEGEQVESPPLAPNADARAPVLVSL